MSGISDVLHIAAANQGGFVVCLLLVGLLYRKLNKCEERHKNVEQRCTQLEIQVIRLSPKTENLDEIFQELQVGKFSHLGFKNGKETEN